jgi:hypothetical protein
VKRLLFIVTVAAAMWAASSFGYFWLQPYLGADIGYNDAPFFYTAYYGAWSALALFLFHPKMISRNTVSFAYDDIAIFLAMLALAAAFLILVLPQLPPALWTRAETPVDFFYANSWYFVPKSFEILFQQILIIALVQALATLKLSIRRISVWVAVLFGAFHLSLALSYDNPAYVLRYTISATIFGTIVPYLVLKHRHGYLMSYAIHWGFYAIDITVIHVLFAAPA